MRIAVLLAFAAAMTGCTTIGTVGVLSRSTGDAAAMIKNGRPYKEIKMTDGYTCKYFILGIFPIGNADVQAALDDALAKAGGGDALINVTTSNSLYGFFPIYNVWTTSCTEVRGMAIKFIDVDSGAPPLVPPGEPPVPPTGEPPAPPPGVSPK